MWNKWNERQLHSSQTTHAVDVLTWSICEQRKFWTLDPQPLTYRACMSLGTTTHFGFLSNFSLSFALARLCQRAMCLSARFSLEISLLESILTRIRSTWNCSFSLSHQMPILDAVNPSIHLLNWASQFQTYPTFLTDLESSVCTQEKRLNCVNDVFFSHRKLTITLSDASKNRRHRSVRVLFSITLAQVGATIRD